MFKKKCNHEKIQTLTNIYGDAINYYNARSIAMCIYCGKKFYKDSLDKNCNRSNEFEIQNFILPGKTIGDVSDGYHTFDELYYHRAILFATICNSYKDKAWKSLKHHDGTMYDGYFIVGIDTSNGQYSYHYSTDLWKVFDVKELENAPEWDGHKPNDIDRLLSLIK